MDIAPEVDYVALYEQAIHENERLRLRVLKFRYSRSVLDLLPIDEVRAYVSRVMSNPEKAQMAIFLFMVVVTALIVPLFRAVVSHLRRKRFYEK